MKTLIEFQISFSKFEILVDQRFDILIDRVGKIEKSFEKISFNLLLMVLIF